jgi:hypothetical protein
VVGRVHDLAKRGLSGRAYRISGQSRTGKTTIARLIAAEVADGFGIEEVDASALTVARLQELEREMQIRGRGERGSRAYIINEAHGLCKDVIRQLLVMLERTSRRSSSSVPRRSKDRKAFSMITTMLPPCCPSAW